MGYAPKIVLHCTRGYRVELDALVERFIADGVMFVAVAWNDFARIEDIFDELVVGDGSDESRFILTSSHPGKALSEVIEFARTTFREIEVEPQVVEF